MGTVPNCPTEASPERRLLRQTRFAICVRMDFPNAEVHHMRGSVRRWLANHGHRRGTCDPGDRRTMPGLPRSSTAAQDGNHGAGSSFRAPQTEPFLSAVSIDRIGQVTCRAQNLPDRPMGTSSLYRESLYRESFVVVSGRQRTRSHCPLPNPDNVLNLMV
jgi:hypothetical protein